LGKKFEIYLNLEITQGVAMRVLICAAACLFCTQIFALGFQDQANLEHKIESIFQSRQLVGRGGKPIVFATGAVPIRQAKINVRIKKSTAATRPDGSYYFQVEDVCNMSTALNVYDARSNGISIDQKDMRVISCDATYLGTAIHIIVGGALALASRPLFADQLQDIKGAYPFLWAETISGRGNVPPMVSDFLGTADIRNSSSMLMFLEPANVVSCTGPSTCRPAEREYFSAIVEILD
jgi:hypothetical protein